MSGGGCDAGLAAIPDRRHGRRNRRFGTKKLPKAQQELHKEQLRAVLRTLKCLIKHEQMLRTRCPELDLFESERRP